MFKSIKQILANSIEILACFNKTSQEIKLLMSQQQDLREIIGQQQLMLDDIKYANSYLAISVNTVKEIISEVTNRYETLAKKAIVEAGDEAFKQKNGLYNYKKAFGLIKEENEHEEKIGN